MTEKRKHERINTQIKSEVHTNAGMTFSSTVDLSAGGIFISTPEPIQPGTELDLAIRVVESESIKIKGIVRWIKEDDMHEGERSGMGIEFVSIEPGDMKRLKAFLDS
jgi:Tfp pilus assembly protein PilZ